MKSFAKFLIILAVLSATIEAAEYRRTGSDGRHYYINSDEKYNWYQAVHKCEQQNMHLIEIDSAAKNNVLLPILRSIFKSPPNLWLGANDEYNGSEDRNRPFYWSTSGKRMTFSYWSQGNPDNYKHDEHCVQIYSEVSNYRWNDNTCTKKMGYICEENYVSTGNCQELEAKRKRISEISANTTANNQRRQEQQTEYLVNGLKSFEQLDTQLDNALKAVQTKLEADMKQLMTQNMNAAMAAIKYRNVSMQKRANEIKTAVDNSNKQFSDQLQSSQKTIYDILKC